MEPEIEELKIKLHSNIYPRTTYNINTLEQNFKSKNLNLYRCSKNLKERIEIIEHPVLTAYYTAFLEHYPAILSPDILWILIIQGFSRHVRLNSEKLKHKFVKDVNDVDKIVVTQEGDADKSIKKISSKKWEDIFKDFVEQSKEYVDAIVLYLFTSYFSTTTEEKEYTSQLKTLSIFNAYIEFIM